MEDSVMQQLVSMQIHRCYTCKKTLRLPVMKDPETERNCCGDCVSDGKSSRNRDLEEILRHLSVPCQYQSEGCNQRVKYSLLDAHETLCPNRRYHCPLKWSTGCLWDGYLHSILEHSRDNHPDRIIEIDSGYVPLLINQGLKEVIVLTMKELFIVRMENLNDAVSIQVYFPGNPEDAKQYVFHVGNEDSHPVYPYLAFKVHIDAKRSIHVQKKLGDRILVQIASLENSVAIDEKFLSFFECPVCKHFMRPPIFQCLSGHSLCNLCRPKLECCPICRVNFGNTRNYSLEAMTGEVRIPCVNHEKGCRKVLPAGEIAQHEDQCILKDYKCPFTESSYCGWTGPLDSLPKHLEDDHEHKTVRNDNKFRALFTPYSNVFELYCIVALGNVFRLCHRRNIGDPHSNWSVQLIGPRKNARKFNYKISLVDEHDLSKTMTKMSKCHKFTNQNGIFEECMSIPSKAISWFSNNEELFYVCNVSKSLD